MKLQIENAGEEVIGRAISQIENAGEDGMGRGG